MMRLSTAISLSLHLLTILSFFCVGLGFLILPFFPSVRTLVYHALVQSPHLPFYIGGGFIGLSFLLAMIVGFLNRKIYLTFEMHSPSVQIDKEIILSCLRDHWRHCFKKAEPKIDVEIDANQMLQITTERLPVDLDDEESLKLLERELGFLLAHHFGYKKKFYLSFRV